MKNILLIDDKKALLDELVTALRSELPAEKVDIKIWVPTDGEVDPVAKFGELVNDDTVLVVTDYDLTGQGRTGLFGSTIVQWCQDRNIPVGDYSRGNAGRLPKRPTLFEIRVPGATDDAARFIACIYDGFERIRDGIATDGGTGGRRSVAGVLAVILGQPALESDLSLYAAGFGTDAILPNGSAKGLRKSTLLTYLVGHLLLNSVLRFTGPLLSRRALSAYLGCAESEAESLCVAFSDARYRGPFSALEPYFWLALVDELLLPMREGLPDDFEGDTRGEWNREALEKKLGRKLDRHECPRCAGRNGGFLCPLTNRTVCEHADCSVASSSWLPQGARLCRIERDYYDEWAPILGF